MTIYLPKVGAISLDSHACAQECVALYFQENNIKNLGGRRVEQVIREVGSLGKTVKEKGAWKCPR